LLVIPESRSDIRDPVSLLFNGVRERHWITRGSCRAPFRPAAAPLFAPASCLRSPAFAGMTKRCVDQTSLGSNGRTPFPNSPFPTAACAANHHIPPLPLQCCGSRVRGPESRNLLAKRSTLSHRQDHNVAGPRSLVPHTRSLILQRAPPRHSCNTQCDESGLHNVCA
jgi:hypothetical protein